MILTLSLWHRQYLMASISSSWHQYHKSGVDTIKMVSMPSWWHWYRLLSYHLSNLQITRGHLCAAQATNSDIAVLPAHLEVCFRAFLLPLLSTDGQRMPLLCSDEHVTLLWPSVGVPSLLRQQNSDTWLPWLFWNILLSRGLRNCRVELMSRPQGDLLAQLRCQDDLPLQPLGLVATSGHISAKAGLPPETHPRWNSIVPGEALMADMVIAPTILKTSWNTSNPHWDLSFEMV